MNCTLFSKLFNFLTKYLGNIFRSLIVGSQEDLTVVTSPMHSTTQILLNNRNNCVKSPIQLNQNSSEKFVKLCDNNKKQQQNNLNNSVNLPPPPASPRSPRRSTSAALDYQNAVRYLNCQKNSPCKITVGLCNGHPRISTTNLYLIQILRFLFFSS